MIMLSTFCAFDIFTFVNSLHRILFWSDKPDVLKLSHPCIKGSVKPNIMFSFSQCFLQTTQNISSFSENYSQFHFLLHFLFFVLGFDRTLNQNHVCFIFECCFMQKCKKESNMQFTDNCLSPIPVSYWLIFSCANLILYQKKK